MSQATKTRFAPMATSGKWLWLPLAKPHASTRLFCFPNAGSGASIFRDWPSLLPDDVEVVAIQLPGRENRFGEPLHSELEGVLEALWSIVAGMADRPYFFFGHSMGAMIAFELTRLLQRKRVRGPFHLVVSGRRAPQLPRRRPMLHTLDDEAFLERIGEFNGTPRELLENAELMSLFMPILRNDFLLSEKYHCHDSTSIACPLTALGGDVDADVSEEDLAAWSVVAGGPFQYEVMPGDHFFIHSSRSKLLERLCSITESNRHGTR